MSFHGVKQLRDCDRERERERERERMREDEPTQGGGENIIFLQGSQDWPARPSGSSSIKMKVYGKREC